MIKKIAVFGLFKTPKSIALQIVGKVFQSNLGFPERKEVINKSSLNKRFRINLKDKIWKPLQPFMHRSIDLMFESISLKLKLLSKKKGINNIDLLDIVFLTGDGALIQEVVRKYKIPYTPDLLRKVIICDSESSDISAAKFRSFVGNANVGSIFGIVAKILLENKKCWK